MRKVSFLRTVPAFFVSVAAASTITLTAPDDGAVYDTHSPCVKEFLSHPAERSVRPEEPPLSEDEIKRRDEQNAKYDAWVASGSPKSTRVKKWECRYNFYERNEWTEALYKRSVEESKTWKPFRWSSDFKISEGRIEFSETADFKNPIVENLGKDSDCKRPWFLKLGTKYWWRVIAKDGAGAEVVSDVRSFTTADVAPRMIAVPAFNFRDLGGGVNAEGRKVRQGLIYRGQSTHGRSLFNDSVKTGLDELRWFYVDTLGIRTELDLRGVDEAREAEEKYDHIGLEKVGCRHVFHEVWPYHISHPEMVPKFAEIIREFTKRENYPIYFHCAVGSDRTGTVGVMLDGILGRTDEQIYNDYELPTFNQNLARLRYCRKAAGMFGELDPETSKRGGGSIAENVIAYLHEIGITDAEIGAIRDIMLEK